jgi:hypothetical protein
MLQVSQDFHKALFFIKLSYKTFKNTEILELCTILPSIGRFLRMLYNKPLSPFLMNILMYTLTDISAH